MTPTEEISNDFAETYSNGSSKPEAGGALHRNISQGQVGGCVVLWVGEWVLVWVNGWVDERLGA